MPLLPWSPALPLSRFSPLPLSLSPGHPYRCNQQNAKDSGDDAEFSQSKFVYFHQHLTRPLSIK
jgi:hypothetical protein